MLEINSISIIGAVGIDRPAALELLFKDYKLSTPLII